MEELVIQTGISEKQADQLIEYSRTDELVKRFTTDGKRFADKKHFQDWAANGREVYVLTGQSEELLGIVWFGKKTPPEGICPEYQTTFAIRLYGEARGKGKALDFMKKTFGAYCQKHPEEKKFWLEVSAGNLAAVHLYEKFGFRAASGPDEDQKIMTLSYPPEAGFSSIP